MAVCAVRTQPPACGDPTSSSDDEGACQRSAKSVDTLLPPCVTQQREAGVAGGLALIRITPRAAMLQMTTAIGEVVVEALRRVATKLNAAVSL